MSGKTYFTSRAWALSHFVWERRQFASAHRQEGPPPWTFVSGCQQPSGSSQYMFTGTEHIQKPERLPKENLSESQWNESTNKKRLPRAGLDCESNAHKEARSNSWTYCHAWVTALGAGDFSVLTDTVVKNFTADKVMELLELKLDAYSGNGKHPKIRLWSALTKTCAMCSMSPAPNDVLHPHIVQALITAHNWDLQLCSTKCFHDFAN